MGVGEGVEEPVAEGEADAVGVAVGDWVADPVAEGEGVAVGVWVGVGVPV